MNTGYQQQQNKGAENTLLTLAVEAWRFGRMVERLLVRVNEKDRQRHHGQLRWFQKRLEESLAELGMRIISVEGQEFDPGTAATPVNIEDFASDEVLIVDQMLEPIVMGPGGVIKTGTVTLKRMEQ